MLFEIAVDDLKKNTVFFLWCNECKFLAKILEGHFSTYYVCI